MTGFLLGLFCPHLPAQTYVSIQPDNQGQLITGWGFDIKGTSGYNVTPSYAQTLFVTDKMSILRVPIWGTGSAPAHPSAGVVVGSYYTDQLYAMTNARAANSHVIFFASKKLDGTTSFPDWTKNGSGVIASQYAIMLADYLQYIYTNGGFAIDVLGVDNERTFNEGNITPSNYNSIINNLRSLAASRGFPLPSKFIGPENYDPDTSWLSTLISSGWGSNVDIVGTHYYPGDRPLSNLQTLVSLGGSRPDWHSEVHWDNTYSDVITNAELALATVFDCTDTGLSAYVWWAYTRSGVKGGIEQAFTASTSGTRPVSTTDSVGGSASTLGTLISRAYRSDTGIVIWVLNNTANVYSGCKFNFANSSSGSLTGAASYTQWNSSGSTQGTANLLTATNFAVTLDAHTVTMINVGFQSAYYWDCNGTTGGFGTTPAGTWGASSYWTASSAGTATPTAYTTTTADTVFFGSSLLGFSTAGGPNVPGSVNVGTIIFGSANTANVSLYQTGTINFPAAGTIQQNVISTTSKIYPTLAGAATSMTFSGTGTIQLLAQNTYTGDTIISDATVSLGTNSALPSGTAVTLDNTGHINMNGFNNTVQSVTINNGTIFGSGTLTLNNAGARGIYSSVTHTVPCGIELGSQANSANNLDFGTAAGTTMTLSGVISSASGYGMDIYGGTGTVILSAANTYSGLTTISAGTTLQLSGGANRINSGNDIVVGGTLDMNGQAQTFDSVTGAGSITTGGGALTIGSGNSTFAFSGVISETGSLTKIGTGKATLSGANTYTGGTTISAGTLALASAANRLPSGGDLVCNGTLDMNGYNQNVGAVTGGGAIVTDGGALTVNLPWNDTYDGTISGLGSLTVNGSINRYLFLTGSSSYTGGTTINSGGGIAAVNNNALGGSGTVTVNSGGSLAVGAGITIGQPISIAGTGLNTGTDGALKAYQSGTATLSNTVTLTAASTVNCAASGYNLTLSGATTGIGGYTLTKTGAGTLTLSGTSDNNSLLLNATAGEVDLGKTAGGVRAVAGISGITNGATVKLTGNGGDQIYGGSSGASYGVHGLEGTLNLNGYSESVSYLDGTGGTVDGGSGTPTLTVGESAVTTSFGGLIQNTSGTLSLLKIGTGTLTLSGANNTYSGGTEVDNGTLLLNAASASGTGNVTIGNNTAGAIIQLGAANGIATGATLTFNGGSGKVPILKLAGYDQTVASISDSTTYGVIELNETTASGNATLTVYGSGNSSYSGIIRDHNGSYAGTLALTKTGAGKLTLSGTNTYTGATTVSNGTLLVNGAIGNSAVMVMNGATLGGTGSIGGAVIVQSGGTLSPGAFIGTLSINNRLTLAGTTFVEINSTNGQSDLVQGVTNLTYGGSLVVSNVAGIQPTNGQTFQLFTVPATRSGNFTNITPALTGSQSWSFNPTNGVLSVVSATASYPTNISFSVTGGNLSLSWPATHLGWWAQSNSLGLANPSNWFDIPGSSSLTNLNIVPQTAMPNVFYRLRSP